MEMNRFQSFSKRLSRRILIVIVLTITLVALLVIAFSVSLLKDMTNAYFLSELQVANETIEKSLCEQVDKAELYERMRVVDAKVNAYHPLFPKDGNENVHKNMWAYNIIIDSLGTYIYHPGRQHILNSNFFDDIRQSPDALRKELERGLASGQKNQQRISIDGADSYIFYTEVEGSSWTNAIIVPKDGLLIPTIITINIILCFLVLGLILAYWVSRRTIRRSTEPLRHLAKSADAVAQGNFHASLPDLTQNDEIRQLRDSFANMQQSLTQYIEQLKATTAEKAAFESELGIARDIQMSAVPVVFPERDDIDIYASMTPAKAVGGDLYDFFVRDNELVFCIGDVSGKGIPAALFMMQARSLFRAYSQGELVPDRIVSNMNHDLCQNNDNCMFVTFFVGVFDLTSGRLRFCNAGHEAPVIIGHEARQLPIKHFFPVGAIADASYETEETVIAPQSAILFYTDGLTEATSAGGKLFGDERILNEVNSAIEACQLSPKALIERMTQAVHDFVGDAEQSDDLTMLVMRRK